MTPRIDSSSLIAIVGTGRCGSSLLTELLDGSPDVYVHPFETAFLTLLSAMKQWHTIPPRVWNVSTDEQLYRLNDQHSVESLLDMYASQLSEMKKDLTRVVGVPAVADIRTVLSSRSAYDAASFVMSYLFACANWSMQNPVPQKVMFKTIETPYVENYSRLFPEMKFLHIIRDPFEVYASAKRTQVIKKGRTQHFYGADCLETIVRYRWLSHARALEKFTSHPSHIILKYEDLLRAPEASIERVCHDLGIAMPKRPELTTRYGDRVVLTARDNSSEPGVLSGSRVTRWDGVPEAKTAVLSDRERELIAHATSKHRQYWATGTEGPTRSIFQQLVDWLHTDKWDRINYTGARDRLRYPLHWCDRRINIIRLLNGSA